ncbi:hypothetical protein FA15DRAFT_629478 [Coprinopsis marcescibilis]|uniref:Small ribosomal subunit protein mS35 mitochondrial conserved domain-containing protein n=1 Tax=Coprinopsis marcescibilis TaxID=230819 RepID=A0A5C3LBX6_COPMA|nr:hypothetical protein FA15DRAFT_629478 [Coprinopsis marcescibilis]
MATPLTRSLGLARSLRAPCTAQTLKRNFSVSSPALARRTKTVLEETMSEDDIMTLVTEQDSVQDSPALGHRMLQHYRKVLHYLRVIEHEMPKLVAYRQPFVPPFSTETPIIVRSIDYQGEEHPATAKRVIVVAVDSLPLSDKHAVHKIKLLAGPRWSPNPPKDAGICKQDRWGEGFIKISCDTFQVPEMNLKWASDALDRLIKEANTEAKAYSDVPLDVRHVYAKIRKAKKGDHLRAHRPLRPVSVADFPEEWLPRSAPVPL